jgi:predicted RNA-binding Zn ribbon-like protein
VVTNSKFKFVAGSLGLDFLNTVGGWIPSGRKRDYADCILGEKLETFRDLVEWARLAGIINPSEARILTLCENCAIVERAVALRASLYRTAKSLFEGWRPPQADLDRLNQEIAAAEAHRRLAFSGGKLIRTWDEPDSPDRMLWSVVESAAKLLTSPDAALVRQCPGSECGWFFLDASRNRARRWCQMQTCGNRAKVKRFRREGRNQ